LERYLALLLECLYQIDGGTRLKVIGTVGLIGSGKDTVISYVSKEFGIPMITISDLVKKIALEQKLEPTRENLTKLSLDCIKKYGRDFFPMEVVKIIEKNRWNVVGVAGIRSFTDVETFRKRFGEEFSLIFVDVPDANIRFERIRKRGEPRDPKSLDEFLEQDKEDEKNFKLSHAIKEADYVVRNDKDVDSLGREIDEIMPRILESRSIQGAIMKKQDNWTESASATVRAAGKLLKSGDFGMAATYYWSAGNTYEQGRKYRLSAVAHERAAYCHELDGHWDSAAEEYLSAYKMYEVAGLATKAKTAKAMADQNMTKLGKE
jgi:dephospho-CoA kinase